MLRKSGKPQSNAQQILTLLSLTNLGQCVSYFAFGACLLLDSTLTTTWTVSNIAGANLEGCYETYCVFSAVPALNRILHVIAASRIEHILFGSIGLKVARLRKRRMRSPPSEHPEGKDRCKTNAVFHWPCSAGALFVFSQILLG